MAINYIKAENPPSSSIDKIRVITGEEFIRENFSDYLEDEAHYGEGRAEQLFYAKSEGDVIAVVKWANETQTPLTVSAGRTGLTGGAVPLDGVLLTLEQMNSLLGLGFDEKSKEWYLRAEAGVTLETIRTAIQKKQLDTLLGAGSPEEQAALSRFLEDPQTYFFPPDPTEMTAHLGGAVVANASGARSFKYKAFRNWVRRIRVVLTNGDVLDIRRGMVMAKDNKFVIELTNKTKIEVPIPDYKMPNTKNAAGLYSKPDMDLIDLFIGSEGILGIVTEAEIRLAVYPPQSLTVFAFFPTEDAAIEFVHNVRNDSSKIQPTLIEYFDSNSVQMLREAREKGIGGLKVPPQVEQCQAIIFFEVTFAEEEMETTLMTIQELLGKHGIDMDGTWAGLDPADLEKMKAVRHLIPETVNALIAQRKQKHPRVHKLGTDMAVPDEHLETIITYYKKLLDKAGMEYIMFGHIGDNHLHVNILPRNDEEVDRGMQIYHKFARKAVELEGTVSAEHGIGKLKRPFLRIMYGDNGIKKIARVKQALDPQWILNPGNMIPIAGEPPNSLEVELS